MPKPPHSIGPASISAAMLGYAWGNSNWTASTLAGTIATGSFSLAQPVDTLQRVGKLFRRASSRLQLHASEPVRHRRRGRRNVSGLSKSGQRPRIGGTSALLERRGELWRERALVRHRCGAASVMLRELAFLCDWRLCLDLRSIHADANGAAAHRNRANAWRLGWAAGAGAEVPVAPHWTARLEYLFTGYGYSGVTFPARGAAV